MLSEGVSVRKRSKDIRRYGVSIYFDILLNGKTISSKRGIMPAGRRLVLVHTLKV
jgi:hypothetical protein